MIITISIQDSNIPKLKKAISRVYPKPKGTTWAVWIPKVCKNHFRELIAQDEMLDSILASRDSQPSDI